MADTRGAFTQGGGFSRTPTELSKKKRATTDTPGRGPSKTGFKDMNRPKKPRIRPDDYLMKALAAAGVGATAPVAIEADPRLALINMIMGGGNVPSPAAMIDEEVLEDVEDEDD